MDKVYSAVGGVWEGILKFGDPNYALEFAKTNPMLILMIVIWMIKLFSGTKPIKEPEGSLVQPIKTLAEWNSGVKKAAAEEKLVVVDFYADWCPPCRTAAPLYSSLSVSLQGKPVVFWKINVDSVNEVTSSQQIRSMPTFRIFGKSVENDGTIKLIQLNEMLGWQGKDKLREMINEQLVFHENKTKARNELESRKDR